MVALKKQSISSALPIIPISVANSDPMFIDIDNYLKVIIIIQPLQIKIVRLSNHFQLISFVPSYKC